MRRPFFLSLSAITLIGIALVLSATPTLAASTTPKPLAVKHVLLISVDGLHAVDLARYVNTHPNSAMAALAATGTDYTQASTTKPSDSFPGLMSMVTGGSPGTTGVFYDDSYDRTLYAPTDTNCAAAKPGTEVVYAENLDADLTKLDGGGINPANLPRIKTADGCVPLYPHSFLKVNTIFNVANAAKKYTAWSDKHPAYEIVNGPSNKGVQDLYTPEINSLFNGTNDYTNSEFQTQFYDNLKVQAILNEIDGKTSVGTKTKTSKTPAIFGMNFQAVSVGQKLTVETQLTGVTGDGLIGFKGGYLDAQGTPDMLLASALDFVDASLGKFRAELSKQKLLDSTVIILTAKHGQSPIDITKLNRAGGSHIDDLVNAAVPGVIAQDTTDDVALLWLNDQSKTAAVAKAISADSTVAQVFSGDFIKLRYKDPTSDARTPDIVVVPNQGVIYTGSKKKVSEHGGFSFDDTNVALLVSNTKLAKVQTAAPVATTQIAPTILAAIGLKPSALQAVQQEKTSVLPGLGLTNK